MLYKFGLGIDRVHSIFCHSVVVVYIHIMCVWPCVVYSLASFYFFRVFFSRFMCITCELHVN